MASFEKFWPEYLKREGAYSDDPYDSGNYSNCTDSEGNKYFIGTKYGIAGPTWENWQAAKLGISAYCATDEEIRNITKNQAKEIIYTWYWQPLKASDINHQMLAENFADWHAHRGGAAKKDMQRILNNEFGASLTVDGQIGPLTLQAINGQDGVKLYNALLDHRYNWYATYAKPEHLEGFRNRLKRYFPYLEAGQGGTDSLPAQAGFYMMNNKGWILAVVTALLSIYYFYNQKRK